MRKRKQCTGVSTETPSNNPDSIDPPIPKKIKPTARLPCLTRAEVKELELFNVLLDEASAATIEEVEALGDSVHNPEARDKRRRFVASVRREACANSGGRCWYCGALAPDGHADHVIPWARGGRSTRANARWACRACNLAKGARVW